MAHVLDVAKYVLEQQGAMTALKLQKLVYYAQAWSTVATNKAAPLFRDTVAAWVQGPVTPTLFQHHKGLHRVDASLFSERPSPHESEQRLIDSVLAHYGSRPAPYLSKLSHFERPWKDAREHGERVGHASPQITVDAMFSFYAGRTPEQLEIEFQMSVARQIMDEHAIALARLAR